MHDQNGAQLATSIAYETLLLLRVFVRDTRQSTRQELVVTT